MQPRLLSILVNVLCELEKHICYYHLKYPRDLLHSQLIRVQFSYVLTDFLPAACVFSDRKVTNYNGVSPDSFFALCGLMLLGLYLLRIVLWFAELILSCNAHFIPHNVPTRAQFCQNSNCCLLLTSVSMMHLHLLYLNVSCRQHMNGSCVLIPVIA